LLPVLQVVEGYEVVKAVEACGSRGGETAADVMIADCGLLKPGGYSQHR
jgi:peptidyl-prolyl isomerase F (cyclophilin D)